MQSVIAMILDGVAEQSVGLLPTKVSSIRDRFLFVFDAHHLDLPALAEIMSEHQFTLSALGDSHKILDLLTRDALCHVASTFHVNVDWLSGSNDTVIRPARWYNTLYALVKRVYDYTLQGLSPRLLFIRRIGSDFQGAYGDGDVKRSHDEPIGLAIEIIRKTLSGKEFHTVELLQFERWGYSRCREEFKILVLWAENASVRFSGIELDQAVIEVLERGDMLPFIALQSRPQGIWFPDEYASLRHPVRFESDEVARVQQTFRESQLAEVAPPQS